ncbi:MAG: helix-turn-helix domain-containing protein [Oscillospiraceae bacterium]
MDQIKTGQFIAAMRKARGLTQEELGERLGVTNKTVSRWETGRYMPDIDKLQELSAALGVSVNELLTGERMADPAQFARKADENLVKVLSGESPFSLRERVDFFKRKWRREHKGYIALCLALWLAALAGTAFLPQLHLWGFLALWGLGLYAHARNQMMTYVEQRAFGPRDPDGP